MNKRIKALLSLSPANLLSEDVEYLESIVHIRLSESNIEGTDIVVCYLQPTDKPIATAIGINELERSCYAWLDIYPECIRLSEHAARLFRAGMAQVLTLLQICGLDLRSIRKLAGFVDIDKGGNIITFLHSSYFVTRNEGLLVSLDERTKKRIKGEAK